MLPMYSGRSNSLRFLNARDMTGDELYHVTALLLRYILVYQRPRSNPDLLFPNLAGGRSQVSQTVAFISPQCSALLNHSSGYSSNSSGPKTGLKVARQDSDIELPISLLLLLRITFCCKHAGSI